MQAARVQGEVAVSRLVRGEMRDGEGRGFVVAGERGAVEMREYPGYYWRFYVHSPVNRPEVALRCVQATWRGGRELPGLSPHRCRILEGDCWTGLTYCGTYDFERPDVEEVVQWEALEDLYRKRLEAR